MKRLLPFLFLIAPSIAAQTLDARIERELPALVETYKKLHAAPELSMREEKTSMFLAAELRKLGYTVTERVGRYAEPGETCYGVVAVLKNGDGPTLLVRTDMDALPITEQTGLPYASTVRARPPGGDEAGVMHACGHDVHVTTLLGAARVLAGMRDSWRGTLVLIGQPAEEIGQGAAAMLADGLYERFPKPDMVIALHDWPSVEAGKVGYRAGYFMANIDAVDLTIRGSGGHGAAPEKAKDPIVVAAGIIMALQTIVSRETSPLDSAVVTVGSIHGGTKRNIIPDEVKLQLTVRSYKADVRKRLLASIERIARGTAIAAGIPEDRAPIVTVHEKEAGNAVYNDPSLVARLVKALTSELGADRIHEIDPAMVSEDFVYYGLDRQIPIAMFALGAGDRQRIAAGDMPNLHSSKFAPQPEPVLRTGVEAMTAMVLELMGR